MDASLELENGTLHYRGGGNGPLVVFAHALGPLAWGDLERLRQTCTIAIPDWERSTVPPRTMGELDWFEALTTSLGFERSSLCAWSMSGPAALYYAADAPQTLERLVLVDVAGLGPSLPPLRFLDLPHLLFTRLAGHPTRGLVRAMWRHWVHQEHVDTKPLEEATYRFFRDVAGALEDPSADDEEEEESLIELLPRIHVPTLVLSGRHSTVLGPRAGRTAEALLPNGEHVVFEESSHTLQLEEPGKFEATLAAFLTGAGSA